MTPEFVTRIPGKLRQDVSRVSFSGYGPWISALLIIVVLLAASEDTITSIQLICAIAMLALSVHGYQCWQATRDSKIPVWALLCGIHFITFGVAIFVATRTSPSQHDGGAVFPDTSLDNAMLLGLAGLISIGAGRLGSARVSASLPLGFRLVDVASRTPTRIYILLVVGILTNLLGTPGYGTSLFNVSVVMLNVLPMAAYVWFVLKSTKFQTGQAEFLLGAVFFITRLSAGAKFGVSLGTVVAPVMLTGLALVSAKRRIPWRAITVIACLVLFLQPSKGIIRQEMASGSLTGSGPTIFLKWCETAASGWSEVLGGQLPASSLITAAASRASLLSMTTLVVEKTPEQVPFQHGALYPLLLQNLVPRFLWADKPTVNVANQFFQVAYGLTSREELNSVSIACGFEAEGYMNFGWYGVVGVGLLVGLLIGYYERLFFRPSCSLGATAVGLALLPGFLTVESQLVQYLGGVLQMLVAAVIVFNSTGKKGQTA